MPFETNSDLPDAVRSVLPAAAQTIFRNVVNSALEGGAKEESAFAQAWGALKNQGWEKGEDGKWIKMEKRTMSSDVHIQGEIKKIDEAQRLVFGWASVVIEKDGETVVDIQGDIIEPEELEKAAYDFVLFSRDAGEMHERIGVGKMVESVVFTLEKQQALGIPEGVLPIGWWVGFKVDDDIFEKAKSGEFKMFSIGGVGMREPVDE